MNNSNKTVLITGISSGIGLALTKKFLNENYSVIGTTRNGIIQNFSHPNLQVVALDLTNNANFKQVVDKVITLTKGIDLLINNAGTAPDVFAGIPDINSFNETIATNVTGTVFFTEALLPYLKNDGQVLFISSAMGLPDNAAPNGTAYRLSKAAINMYAAILATRLNSQNIKVTPVHPGWVQTKLGGSNAPYTPNEAAENIYNGISLTKSGKFWDATVM